MRKLKQREMTDVADRRKDAQAISIGNGKDEKDA